LAATGCVIAPYYYYYYYLTQALSSQGMKKITLCNKKVQKSSWNEPYSSSFTPLLLLQFMLKVLFD